MMTIYFVCMQRIDFWKDTFSFNYNFIFYDFKTSLKNTFIRKNYLKYKVINLFLIINIINDQSKLEKLETNFEDKTSSIIKMSKSELISSVSEDEINETEESETSDDGYLMILQSCNHTCMNLVFQKSQWKKTAPEKNHQIWKKTLVGLDILPCVLVVNTNQWLLMQKAFAAWINMKFRKVISKVHFHSFLKYFYPVIY